MVLCIDNINDRTDRPTVDEDAMTRFEARVLEWLDNGGSAVHRGR